MNSPPEYFELIRQHAEDDWKQLAEKPRLAAPWRTLFKQVQDPRHVVSELLQNADDAGATKIIIRAGKSEFIFKHNGKDFTKKDFAALCSFGSSSKRTLHTIGFRGIGFKSVFSLGKWVELFTPTLSVAFDRDRFTEPKWGDGSGTTDQFTIIRVATKDFRGQEMIERNLAIVKRDLQEWLKNPVSLLFFRNIRQIQINESKLRWSNDGPGPTQNAKWLKLHDSSNGRFLIIRSEPNPFPDNAVEEIREERGAGISEDIDLPPCSVEIVLGAEGCLYSVLPSGIVTELPFACNAPFVQDPARTKIKSPEESPTNRWLLERVGKLAAETMLQWLQRRDLDYAERAKAYDLMPDVDREDTSLEGICGTIVEEAFAGIIQEKEFLLTEDGQLVAEGQSIIMPKSIFDVWPSAQAVNFFDDKSRLILSNHVSDQNQEKLINWRIVEVIDDNDIINALQSNRLPKPKPWKKLLNLWIYLEPIITSIDFYSKRRLLCIVPAQGEDVLYAANETGRLGRKKLIPAGDDWHFLGGRSPFLDPGWLRFLRKNRRVAESDGDQELIKKLRIADSVLEAISLNKPTEIEGIMNAKAADFFADETRPLEDVVKIAHIFAKYKVKIDNSFRFACEDQKLRSIEEIILADIDGDLDLLLPEEWSASHLLHPSYLKEFKSCTQEEWQQWVLSGHSGLHCFVPPQNRESFSSQKNVEEELKWRGYMEPFSPYYRDPWFRIDDWDFEKEVWNHWESLAKRDDTLWSKIMKRILMHPKHFWSAFTTATVIEIAKNGHTRFVIRNNLVPGWILRFREKNCLFDTYGILRKPAELLRRTPKTDALRDIEPFIDAHLDNHTTEPLLELLGVGAIPTGPKKLLDRIRALAKAGEHEIHEVGKWYGRLDQLIINFSTEDIIFIKTAFKNERLILTESRIWKTSDSVFLTANESDAPGAEIIHTSVRSLGLWLKIGVEERPTPELAISWLQNLPSGSLVLEDFNRVKILLARYPIRVWEECQHWLSLSRSWLPSEEFEYALTEQSSISWEHLHRWVKDKTADLQNLSIEITQEAPFKPLLHLVSCIEKHLHQDRDSKELKQFEWLKQLGQDLQRVILEDQDEMDRIRDLAKKLADIKWRMASNLEIICYIDGKPAGPPQFVDANWSDETLYVEDKPLVRLADAIIMELAGPFSDRNITEAIKMCFDRSEAFVKEYMEGHFDLISWEEIEKHKSKVQIGRKTPSGTIDNEDSEVTKKLKMLSNELNEMNEKEIHDSSSQETVIATEPLDEEDGEYNVGDDVTTRAPQKEKPSKRSIMERYALKCGFQKNNNNQFLDEHGNRIIKSVDSFFPWEKRSASGEIICYYWAKDHCLRRDPLEIEFEVWSAVEKSPETYVLILSDLEGQPIEIKGTKLQEMKDRKDLELYPSTYRLVLRNDGDI